MHTKLKQLQAHIQNKKWQIRTSYRVADTRERRNTHSERDAAQDQKPGQNDETTNGRVDRIGKRKAATT
ncbi:MAG: hypothetical protein AAFV33_09955, partial [Chloroflexota bacterium]